MHRHGPLLVPLEFGQVDARRPLLCLGQHAGDGIVQSGDFLAAECCDPPENVMTQFLKFTGESHDVDQRRTQIVADNVGEALDFIVGLAKLGRTVVHGGFQIEIIVA